MEDCISFYHIKLIQIFIIYCMYFLLRPLPITSAQKPDQWMSYNSEMQFLSASTLFQTRGMLVEISTGTYKDSSGRKLNSLSSSASCPASSEIIL